MKSKYYTPIVKTIVFIIDFCLINQAFVFANWGKLNYGMPERDLTSFFLIFSLLWVAMGSFFKIYRIHSLSLIRTISINLLNAFLAHIFMIAVILNTLNVYRFVSIDLIFNVYVLAAVFIIGSRIAYKVILKYIEFSGFDQRNAIIVGATRSGKAVHDFFRTHQGEGYHFKGFFDDSAAQLPEYSHLLTGGLGDVKDFCIRENIDEVYFTLPLTAENERLLNELSRFADDHFIYFRIAPDFSKVVHNNYNIFLINSVPIFTPRKEPMGISFNVILKRVFDIAFSLTVILTVFPVVVPLIALAIRLDSEGPIIFKQLRPGKKNRLFECYKFRTMRVNSTTELQASKNDSRITRVGRFLRKTNLDELPQFFNVLLGNMSVVGPRPNMISQLEEYSKTIDQYKVRHFIAPGITGYAQVNGLRGETREPGLMEKRVEYDVLYLENWSLSLDIKIIFLTIWNMIKGEKNAF